MPYTTIISTEQLAQLLGRDDVLIFDSRHNLMDVAHGRREYAKGHIPGAVFVHLDEDLSAKPNGKNGRHPLPVATEVVRKFASLGVSANKQVVIYDDAGGANAARMWWMLRWLGHEPAAVLDGGMPKWLQEGRATTTTPSLPEPAEFRARALAEATVDADYVLRNLHAPQMLVIDARANDRFHGQNETIDPIGGHIPGAVNRFFKLNLNADGSFKAPAQLREEFTQLLGARSAAQVVNQCGSGVTACHNQLAMEIAGLRGAKIYPGSWSEWISDPARPRATD